MEEEDEGLDILVQQRQTRPSYRRVISEEFSERHPQEPRGTKTQQVSKSPATEDTEKNIEENQVFDEGSEGLSDSELSSDGDYVSAAEEISENEDQEVLSLSDTVGGDCASAATRNYRQTKSSVSKKQRQRQRQRLRSSYTLPFMDVDDIGCTEMSPSGDLVEVPPDVPSLASMCLTAHCLRHAHRGPLPPGLTRPLKVEQRRQVERSALIAWLQRALETCEKTVLEYLIRLREGRVRTCDDPIIKRSDKDMKDERTWYFYRDTSCISFPCHYGDSVGYLPQTFPEEERHHEQARKFFMFSALTKLVDLLIPRHTTKHNSSEEEVRKQLKTALMRVKVHLAKSFPNLVEFLFWEVVPYVWWARGYPARAEEAFVHLINGGSRILTDAQKALYSNELARMYLQHEEYGKATKFFLLACDSACKSKEPGSIVSFRRTQSQVLIAAGLDTGVMSDNHSSAAIEAWDRVLEVEMRDPDRCHRVVDAAIASVMCHHSGIAFDKDTETWYQSATRWLEKYGPQSRLALSLVHAMQGLTRESTKEFRSYNHSYGSSHDFYAHAPGFAWIPADRVYGVYDSNGNPWGPIISEAELQKRSIPPMRAIWRRKLSHFAWHNSGKWMVGDDDHEAVHIGLTEDGLLSCDVHLSVPPVGEVLFDPVTGEIKLTEAVPFTTTCHSSDPPNLVEYRVPRSYQVYEDHSVRVIYSESVAVLPSGNRTRKNQITWKHKDGSTAEFNIKRAIREQIVKLTKERIKKEAETAETTKVLLDTLENHMKNGGYVHYEAIDTEPNKLKVKLPVPLFGVHLVSFVNLEEFLLMTFSLENGEVNEHNPYPSVLVIINCKSREEFVKPVIVRSDINHRFTPVPTFLNPGYRHRSKADIFVPSALHGHVDCSYTGAKLFAMFQWDKKDKKDKRGTHSWIVYNMEGTRVKASGISRLMHSMFQIVKDTIAYSQKDTSRIYIESLTEESVKTVTLPTSVETSRVLMGYILVLTQTSLVVIDTDARTLPWKMYNSNSNVSDDGTHLVLDHRQELDILTTERYDRGLSDLSGPVLRAVVAYGNHILIIEVPTNGERMDAVHCILDIQTAGTPTEACFISDQVGFLVTATVFHHQDSDEYRENLYHYTYEGRLVSLLADLGHGPHGLFPLYHPGTRGLEQRYPGVPFHEAGWYVYFRDGHGAIMCACMESL